MDGNNGGREDELEELNELKGLILSMDLNDGQGGALL
jgi:hypothetical protein